MKGKILTAKVIVFILLFLLIGLSLLKFIDYLNKPVSRFYDVLESVNTDVNDVMDTISKTDIYDLFNTETYNINIDSSINASGLVGTEYERYDELLNNSRFVSKIGVDKNKNFINGLLSVVNNLNNYDINYYENRTEKYLGSNGEYTKLLTGSNIKLFDTNKITSLINFIKDNNLNNFNEENISSSESAIGINGKTYDVLVSSYEISGEEINSLVRNAIVNLSKNSTYQNYLIEVLGTSKSELAKVLNEKYEKLGIISNRNYLLNAYVDSKNNDTLRFALVENNTDERVLISYSMLDDYHEFFMNVNESVKIIKFIGKVDEYKLEIEDEKQIVSFSSKLDGDSYKGLINITDATTNQEKIKMVYSYIKTINNNDTSLSLKIVLIPVYISSNMNVEINSSILISKNADVQRIGVSNYTDEIRTDVKLKNYIDDYLEKVYNQFNGIVDYTNG